MHVRSNEIRDDLRLQGDALPDSDDAGDAMAVEEELSADADDDDRTMDEDDDDGEGSGIDTEITISEDVLEAAKLRQGAPAFVLR